MINKDFAKRRDKLLRKIEDKSAIFIFSETQKFRNNDVAYDFRQSSNFYYLTGINDPSTALIIQKHGKATTTTLVCKRPNNLDKLWNGQVPSKLSYKKNLNIENIIYYDELNSLELGNIKNLYFEFKDEKRLDDILKKANLADPKARYDKNNDLHSTRCNLSSLIFDMRRIKSKGELSEMRYAAKISANAHINLIKTCKPGMREFEIEAKFIEFCMKNQCKQAYPAIVASGKNACILHYTKNSSTLKPDTLLLVDAAAEYNNYASDITRTIPVSGKFTEHQKLIYELVLKSQQKAIEACKPGKTLVDIHNVAVKNITKGLIKLKILKGTLDKNIREGKYKKYYMHNTGHWLGLDVHDPSSYAFDGEPIVLKPGMVFTVEPGIYINNDSDLERGFHNIGVRIEDDIVITRNGCEVLSKDVPKSVMEIEKLMSHD